MADDREQKRQEQTDSREEKRLEVQERQEQEGALSEVFLEPVILEDPPAIP